MSVLKSLSYYIFHVSAVMILWILFGEFFKAYPERYFDFFPTLFWLVSLVLPILHLLFYHKVATQKIYMQRFMLTMVVKIFGILILVLIYKFKDGEQKMSFILSLFILYVVFQTIEIVNVLGQLRRLS